MPRCPTQVDAAAWLSLLLMASCSDAVVPPAPFDAALPDAAPMVRDAAPPSDACPCRAQGLASHIYFRPNATEIYDRQGVLTGCVSQNSDGGVSAYGELLGGSCALEDGPSEYKAWLRVVSAWWYHIFPRDSRDEPGYLGWAGGWRAPERDDDHRIISTAACLLPAEEGAECVRATWISYTVETSRVAPQQQLDLRVACTDGLLVAGGCAPKPETDENVPVVRAGFAPGDRHEWLCSFVNEDETIEADVMSLAFCLHEDPLPAECGCCPSLADTFTVRQNDAPLRFGANRLEVQCDQGELLVLGNCMLDAEDVSQVADVRMFRFGYPPTAEHPDGDRSTWGCSWYNPTGNTPRAIAIATAVCLPAE